MPDPFHYPLAQIPEEGCKGIATDRSPEANVLAVRRQGRLYVYRNLCPHLGLPLEWMPDQFLDRDGHYIQCATHGALFRVDNGLCVAGPCQGDQLQAIPFRQDEKSLIIDLSSLPPPSDG